mmetsp:Transcript_27340/g.78744  ORF Transcript_27340/g.78744 Transcript_27340/m.78744 type:complete len:246 (+) Transcript_27340:1140-1877(+)
MHEQDEQAHALLEGASLADDSAKMCSRRLHEGQLSARGNLQGDIVDAREANARKPPKQGHLALRGAQPSYVEKQVLRVQDIPGLHGDVELVDMILPDGAEPRIGDAPRLRQPRPLQWQLWRPRRTVWLRGRRVNGGRCHGARALDGGLAPHGHGPLPCRRDGLLWHRQIQQGLMRLQRLRAELAMHGVEGGGLAIVGRRSVVRRAAGHARGVHERRQCKDAEHQRDGAKRHGGEARRHCTSTSST